MDQLLVARRWFPIVAWGIMAGALAGVMIWWFVHVPMSACEKEARSGDPGRVIQTCLESYNQSKDPRDLVWAAKGYLRVPEFDKADKLAHQLLAGPRYGDAHAILSYVALRRGARLTLPSRLLVALRPRSARRSAHSTLIPLVPLIALVTLVPTLVHVRRARVLVAIGHLANLLLLKWPSEIGHRTASSEGAPWGA